METTKDYAELLIRRQRAALAERAQNVLRWCGRRGLVLPLGGASAVSVVALAVSGSVSPPLALTTFLLVYASYQIDHLAEVNTFGQEMCSARSRALARKGLFGAMGVAAFGGAVVITALAANALAVAILLTFPLAVAFYGTPLLGKLTAGRLGYARLKDVPYLKSLYTSSFWGGLAVFAVTFVGGGGFVQAIFFFLFIALCFFVNTVFCDFKDLDRDRAEGVATLPLQLGAKRTLRLLHRVNWLSLLLLVTAILGGWSPVWLLGLSAFNLYVWEVLERGAQAGADIDFLCDVAMDSEFIFWLPSAWCGLALTSLMA